MMKRHVSIVLSCLALAACAESNTHHDAGPNGPDAVSHADTGADAASTQRDGGTSSGLVVNEIEATGTEFIELFNDGTAPVDLSALRITDDDAGMPNAAHATMLPAGIVLHTGERFVVVTHVTSPPAGLQMGAACTISGVDRCLLVSFGLSNGSGDAAYVLASDDSIVAQASYPAMGAPTGSSYCRLPDGTGAFATCTPTPGAVNAP
jgi:hypothetical protein